MFCLVSHPMNVSFRHIQSLVLSLTKALKLKKRSQVEIPLLEMITVSFLGLFMIRGYLKSHRIQCYLLQHEFNPACMMILFLSLSPP